MIRIWSNYLQQVDSVDLNYLPTECRFSQHCEFSATDIDHVENIQGLFHITLNSYHFAREYCKARNKCSLLKIMNYFYHHLFFCKLKTTPILQHHFGRSALKFYLDSIAGNKQAAQETIFSGKTYPFFGRRENYFSILTVIFHYFPSPCRVALYGCPIWHTIEIESSCFIGKKTYLLGDNILLGEKLLQLVSGIVIDLGPFSLARLRFGWQRWLALCAYLRDWLPAHICIELRLSAMNTEVRQLRLGGCILLGRYAWLGDLQKQVCELIRKVL